MSDNDMRRIVVAFARGLGAVLIEHAEEIADYAMQSVEYDKKQGKDVAARPDTMPGLPSVGPAELHASSPDSQDPVVIPGLVTAVDTGRNIFVFAAEVRIDPRQTTHAFKWNPEKAKWDPLTDAPWLPAMTYRINVVSRPKVDQ